MCIRDRYKAQEEREKIDPATQKPVIGADGKAVTETVEVLRPAFKAVSYTHLDVYKRQHQYCALYGDGQGSDYGVPVFHEGRYQAR